jgi:tetratricopeptide (TPR) repeat protein
MPVIIPILFSFLFLGGDADLQPGVALFNARAENCKGLKADAANIDKAITFFENKLVWDEDVEKAGYYYLASLNFKGQFVASTGPEKKKIYEAAIAEGNILVKRFPKSPSIRFELITSIGLLAEINGVLRSAQEGVINKMLLHSNALVDVDSMYRCGAGWKVLAILNYKTPNIPLVLDWPSREKAKLLLQKALKYYPADISNNFYYAEALLENNEKSVAKIYFELVTRLPARKEFHLEDEAQKEKAKAVLAGWH